MDYGLAGKAAIVTGAAGGIGLACYRALVGEGASVVVADLDGTAAIARAGELGTTCVGVGADVANADDAERLVETAVSTFGRLDVLVTCAGVFHATPFDTITADEWDGVQAVNLKGTFLVAQAALRVMIPRGTGRIVTVASLAGQTGGIGAGASYAASKAGVVALTKSIARLAGPHGINANCVNPGLIETPMLDGWPQEALEQTIAATPLGRLGTPQEVADTVVWLASDRASFVHGAHVDVNGGLYTN
ncbi:MAG: SDR family oxidoreductase [Thermoleophilia bacterium]|nr:SDR family oxidoreductase [Thermoleophilia bacterium]